MSGIKPTSPEHTFQCNSRHPIGAEKPPCNCGAAWSRPWHVGGWGEIWTDDGTKVSYSDAGALREIVVELHNRMLDGAPLRTDAKAPTTD